MIYSAVSVYPELHYIIYCAKEYIQSFIIEFIEHESISRTSLYDLLCRSVYPELHYRIYCAQVKQQLQHNKYYDLLSKRVYPEFQYMIYYQ